MTRSQILEQIDTINNAHDLAFIAMRALSSAIRALEADGEPTPEAWAVAEAKIACEKSLRAAKIL